MIVLPRIGFMGLGVTGKLMTRNLLKGRYPVVVLNRSRTTVEALQTDGAALANSCWVSSIGRYHYYLRLGMIFIDMSTIVAATSRIIYQALKAKGVSASGVPISDGDVGAQQGTFSIMIGREPKIFDRVLFLFQAMGKTLLHMEIQVLDRL